jgi:hypothetical protein
MRMRRIASGCSGKRAAPDSTVACLLVLAVVAAVMGCGEENPQPVDSAVPAGASADAHAVQMDTPASTPMGAGGAGGADAGPDPAAGATPDANADLRPEDAALARPDLGSDAPATAAGAVSWAIDNLQSIAGHPTTVLGAPMVIETPAGKALAFDGVDDALFVENHPLAGLPQFTVEIYFRPDAGGSPAQRFFHMQDDSSGGRVLFETRLPGNNRWVLDVFIESAGGEVAVYDPAKTHPLGAWYHLAAVVDGQRARSYVNGVEQVSFPLSFRPHQGGRTSIGVRITRMYFFKGAIRSARFTPRVLAPAEFLPPP